VSSVAWTPLAIVTVTFAVEGASTIVDAVGSPTQSRVHTPPVSNHPPWTVKLALIVIDST
jgi:hypothetical protein